MLDIHNRLYGSESIYILGIPAYSFFVGLGIIVGLLYYFLTLKKEGSVSEGAVKIVFSGIIFGIIGSKVPLLLEGQSLIEVLYGKSIIGGLLGGMFGVIAVKKVLGIKLKLGNVIAPSVAIGMAIGRLGCFFNGCCYGVVAPWGFNFGDGFLRLPNQLFESVFHITAFILLVYFKNKVKTPGILFKTYLLGYFIFRFLIEFIRENPVVFCGLTIYQLICLLGLIYITIILWKVKKNERKQLE
ncbi:MAG: prolipoprotein diacylglyceryl transferase [Filifactoraceae bacterium]